MTKVTKIKSAKTPEAAPAEVNNIPLNGLILAMNDNALRAFAIYSASTLFAQPQFAGQTNPSNILGLADLMYRYMQGQVNVEQPADTTPNVQAPTFG